MLAIVGPSSDSQTIDVLKILNNYNTKFDITDFNKEYDDYSKKMGFRKNFHNLDMFYPFGYNKKALSDGNHFLLHKLLF